MKSLVVI